MSETKYYDVSLPAAPLSYAYQWTGAEIDPTVGGLFCPAQGSGVSDREGRKAFIKRVRIRGLIGFNVVTGTAVSPIPTVRVILYLDKQTNGAQAQSEQVMAPATSADTALALCAFQNKDNFGRFQVLRDKTFESPKTVAVGTNATTSSLTMDIANTAFKFDYKFKKPLVVHFNQVNGGTIADVVDHSLHVIAMTGSDNLGENYIIAYNSRVYFTDG